MAGHLNRLLHTRCDLLQGEAQGVAQVVTALVDTLATEEAPDVVEDGAHHLVDVFGARRTPVGGEERPKSIEAGALVGLPEDLVGLRDVLEALGSLWIVGVAIGVPLQRQGAVGLLDLILGRLPVDTEDVVIVARHVFTTL